MPTVLITGTSKGLGFELVQHYLESGFVVVGLSRTQTLIKNSNYHHLIADVTRHDVSVLISGFLQSLAIKKLDVVINNAGVGSYRSHLSELDPEEVLSQVNLHCVGALRVVKAVQPYLDDSKIVNVTSRLGSVAQTVRGDFTNREFSYGYRIAKCAQNMLSLSLTNDAELKGNT